MPDLFLRDGCSMNPPWWEYHSNLVSLASWLVGVGDLAGPDQVVRFFEKPWNWGEEWERYKQESGA